MSFHLNRRFECSWEYPNVVGHRNLCFQTQRRQSVKEGTAGTEDAREYDDVHRRAVRSGNYAERTRAKATEKQPWVSFTHWREDSKGTLT